MTIKNKKFLQALIPIILSTTLIGCSKESVSYREDLYSIETCPIDHSIARKEFYDSILEAAERNNGVPPDHGWYECHRCPYISM